MRQKYTALRNLVWLFTVLSVLLSVAPQLTQAQMPNMRASNWFFGKKLNLNFTWDGSYVRAGQISNTVTDMEAEWGCSSISTPSGTLLFYTNGETVWNANHTVMGNGTGLEGDHKLKRSSIIIPRPSSIPGVEPSEYFIFYTTPLVIQHLPPAVLEHSRLMYAGVSPATNTVSVKNQDMTPVNSMVSYCLTACMHANGRDVWLVALSYLGEDFYVYKITPDAIILVGTYDTHQARMAGPDRAYAKFSPNGKYIGLTRQGNHDENASNQIAVFDFDAATGKISNFRQREIEAYPPDPTRPRELIPFVPSALEFSPCSNFVYVLAQAAKYSSAPKSYTIRYRIHHTDVEYVERNGRDIHPLHYLYGGDLQLGPDQRMYVTSRHNIFDPSGDQSYLQVDSFDPNDNILSVGRWLERFHETNGPHFFSLPNFVTSSVDACAPFPSPPCDECIVNGSSIPWSSTQAISVPPPGDYPQAQPLFVTYQTRTCNGVLEFRVVSIITIGQNLPSPEYPVERVFWYLEDRMLAGAFFPIPLAPYGSPMQVVRFYQIPCWNVVYCPIAGATQWEACSDELCCYREYEVGNDCDNNVTRYNITYRESAKGAAGGSGNQLCTPTLVPSQALEACRAQGNAREIWQCRRVSCERTDWTPILP